MLGDFAFCTVAVSAIIGSNALALEKACFQETETVVRHLQPLSNKHFSDHFSFQPKHAAEASALHHELALIKAALLLFELLPEPRHAQLMPTQSEPSMYP